MNIKYTFRINLKERKEKPMEIRNLGKRYITYTRFLKGNIISNDMVCKGGFLCCVG